MGEMVPMAGETDQVSAVLVVPVTVEENCWVWPAMTVAVPGVMATATGGARLMEAVACLVMLAVLVEVTVTVW